MNVVFKSELLADLYQGIQQGKPTYTQEEVRQFIKLINMIRASPTIADLGKIKSCRLHKLSNGYLSLSTNMKGRVVFLHFKIDNSAFIEEFSKNHYE